LFTIGRGARTSVDESHFLETGFTPTEAGKGDSAGPKEGRLAGSLPHDPIDAGVGLPDITFEGAGALEAADCYGRRGLSS
jgi:hypothetical protein